MKIIHCLNHFLPQQVAGTEIYARSLIHELLNKNIDALVIIPNYGKNTTENYVHENIRVIQYAEPSVVNRALIMGKAIPEGLKYFVQAIAEEKPSIVHFHIVGGSNGIGTHHVKAVKEMGIKILLTLHLVGYSCTTGTLRYKNMHPCDGYIDINRCTRCIYATKQMGAMQRNLLYSAAMTAYNLNYDTTRWNTTLGTAIGYPFLVKKLKEKLHALADVCDKMVVLTHWYKKVLEINGIPSHKLEYIAQGLPGNIASKMVREPNAILKIAFIGRITEAKGLHLLIAALQGLAGDQVSLDIYGQVHDDAYTTACIEAAAKMPNVRWMGLLAPEQIVKTLGHYDCLCVPSVICEMSPLVIREAFAAGIPVIASDVYGNAEQVRNDIDGWLFQFNNSDDLEKKIRHLIDQPVMIQAAITKIAPVRTFNAVALEYENLYQEIISGE